ncbi:MAG: hypothetical protein B9S32_13755 [Verrucomicrobia bacterium Tous-C9LFEB]|nr:MAG: hypothetical protein B9S32_13755 [Verrucomicrobia bacterium Tous-C9LFEB]
MSAAVLQTIKEIDNLISELKTVKKDLQGSHQLFHIVPTPSLAVPESGPSPKLYAYAIPSRQSGKDVAADSALAKPPCQTLQTPAPSSNFERFSYRPLYTQRREEGVVTLGDVKEILEGGPLRVREIAEKLIPRFPRMAPRDVLWPAVYILLRKNQDDFQCDDPKNRNAKWALGSFRRPRSKELITIDLVKSVMKVKPVPAKTIAQRISRQVPRLSRLTVYNAVCDLLKNNPTVFCKCGWSRGAETWGLHGAAPVTTPAEWAKTTVISFASGAPLPFSHKPIKRIFMDEMDRPSKVSVDVNQEAYKAWEKPEVIQPTFTPKPAPVSSAKSKSAPAPVTAETLAKIALAQARVDRLRERVTSPRTEIMTRAAVRQLEDDFEAATNELEALKEGARS